MKDVTDIEDVIALVAVALEKRDQKSLDNLWSATKQIVEWSGNGVGGGAMAATLISKSYEIIAEHILLTTSAVKDKKMLKFLTSLQYNNVVVSCPKNKEVL